MDLLDSSKRQFDSCYNICKTHRREAGDLRFWQCLVALRVTVGLSALKQVESLVWCMFGSDRSQFSEQGDSDHASKVFRILKADVARIRAPGETVEFPLFQTMKPIIERCHDIVMSATPP